MPEASTTTAATVSTGSAEQTRALARALGSRLRGGDVVVLSGELGAGKTTFVQGLALGLGVTAPVTSPTFVLARHQRPDPSGPRPDGPDLVHVDAYRLRGALELDDLDLDSDLDTSVVVVEWGEGLAERLSPDRVEVRIDRATGGPGPTGEPDDPADPGATTDDGAEPRAIVVHVVGLAGRDLLTGLAGLRSTTADHRPDPDHRSDPDHRPDPDPDPIEPETPC